MTESPGVGFSWQAFNPRLRNHASMLYALRYPELKWEHILRDENSRIINLLTEDEDSA